MSDSFSHLLTETADAYTQAQTKDAAGAAVVTKTLKASALSCAVQQQSADAMIAYGKEGYAEFLRFYFDADPELTIKDYLRWRGKDYEVIRVNEVRLMGRLWQVDTGRKPTR